MNIGLGAQRRTILLVDPDPHARASLRSALEAAGFSVGEAATGTEGVRTARRVHPDAILTDLVADASEAGGEITHRLAEAGQPAPVYIASTAAEALVGATSFAELGVSGVFLKPVDPAIVVQTLRTRLGVA